MRSREPSRGIELARAAAVTFGGQVAVVAALAAATGACAVDLARGRRPGPVPTAGLAAAVLYLGIVEPWMRDWGTAPAGREAPLPGDELVPDPGMVVEHAVTIDAPAERVWPWLAQIGQDRGGFYSYEWLENLAGCRMRNADRVHPEWQRRDVGEEVMLHPLAPGMPVTIFDPPRAIGLQGWGVFLLQAAGPERTRLLVRGRIPKGRPTLLYRLTLAIPHFVMERRMLLGIKRRAEAAGSLLPAGADATAATTPVA